MQTDFPDPLPLPPHPVTAFPPPPHRSDVPAWLWVVTAVLFGGVVYMQRPEPADPARQADIRTGVIVERDSFSTETLLGKIMLSMRSLASGSASAGSTVPPGGRPGSGSAALTQPLMVQLDAQAKASESAQGQFRVGVLAGEFEGLEGMRTRFDALTPELAVESPLHQDMQTALGLYAQAKAASGGGTPVPIMYGEPEKKLIERHGWVGKLAATAPAAAGGAKHVDAELADFRERSSDDGLVLIVVLSVFMMIVLGALLMGIVVLLVGMVMLGAGKLRRFPTKWIDASPDLAPGLHNGRVWLETFALFVGGFLALSLLRHAFPQALGLWFALLAQWALVLTLFWPVVRGMPFSMFRAYVGWHRGRGLVKETEFGLLAYIAAFPVYLLIALVVVLLMYLIAELTGQKTIPNASDRIVDMASGGVLQLVMVLLLGSVWAPIVEETVFRGAVFRFLRSRNGARSVWSFPLALVISSVAFALMHGYMVQQLILVGCLGAIFALMRESRGSILAPIAAHCAHNTLVFSLVFTLVAFGSDR